ncbi:MAG: hypothetical protein M3209_19500 [Acidobacteriota bacterium]|nr:hypothetical protein [Acidobacteriota bacterium]
MRRNLNVFLRFCFLAFCCFSFSIVFGQTDDRADLTGNYAGALKFPSANLNGKATLSVEGNKFVLRGANGSEKTGRITGIKTGGDYVSVALMFEETPSENQPFNHSIMSVRLRKTGKNVIISSAPGEEREFRFEAVAETANNKTNKFADASLTSNSKAECADPKSAKCGVNFGFVAADDLEKAATPNKSSSAAKKVVSSTEKVEKATPKNNDSAAKTKTTTENLNKTTRKNPVLTKSNFKKSSPEKIKSSKIASKAKAKKPTVKPTASESSPKKEPAKTAAPTERANPPKAAEPKPSPSPTPKPSPASNPNQNANKANVGKGTQ